MFFSLNAITSMDLMNRIALVCIPIVLILIAMILPKGKVMAGITRVLMVLLLVGVAVLPMIQPIADLIGLSTKDFATPYFDSFVPPLMLVEALILLWGLFFNNAYLTQGLYGMVLGISFTVGVAGFAFPVWLNAVSFADALVSPAYLLGLLQYAALVFVPVWLLASGAYHVKLGSTWQVLFGMTFFGSLLLYSQASGLITSPFGEKLAGALNDGAAFTPNTDSLIYCGVIAGAALVVTFLICLAAPIGRRAFYHTGEKMIASETKGALWTRLIGHVFSGVGGVALVVLMPSIISLTGLDGTVAELLYLAPIVYMLLVQLFIEFFSEDAEIKRAQADFAAAHSAA